MHHTRADGGAATNLLCVLKIRTSRTNWILIYVRLNTLFGMIVMSENVAKHVFILRQKPAKGRSRANEANVTRIRRVRELLTKDTKKIAFITFYSIQKS